MNLFSNDQINLELLHKRAFNFRWAEVEEGVIPLTAADPDFPAAPEIVKAIIAYSRDGCFSYTPKLGLPEFRIALSRALLERKNETVDPELILPIDSAARGMEVIAATTLKPGDEAIVFDPVDFLFKTTVERAGAKAVLFPAKIKEDHIDLSSLEKYIGPKTKMICLCNPHNPLGTVYPKEDLLYILDLADKYDLWIMNDEIWSDIIFPEKPFLSILSVRPEPSGRILSVFGFSKSFGVAGLRIGCVYCTSAEIFERIVEKSGVLATIGGIPSLSQIAGMACVEQSYYWVDAFIQHLTKNRDYALGRLEKMPGIRCFKPQATYLLFPEISSLGITPEILVEKLQKEEKVAVIPGTARFFGPGAEGHIRICFATSLEILIEGLDRLERGILKLKS
jgi:aspartate/methionine/tyrosine aminotransferase